ncbi:hypothetical protein K3495_g12744 [Podosphaera aphanis]|nr:hypothetical protein K3495_g12744 [Podosphaera aphanis]
MSLPKSNREDVSSSGTEATGSDHLTTTSTRRIKHQKVKTGCITCRNRRVKCDEAKPSCQRCIKYGTQCGGYKTKPPKSQKSNNSCVRVRPLRPKILYTGPIPIAPSIITFDNNLEHNYFNLFSNQIVQGLSPYFDPENWTRLVLQACTLYPSVRHAAVAIGALGRTCEIARLCKKTETGERIVMDVRRVPRSMSCLQMTSGNEMARQAHSHHRQALEQYEKAIGRMRDDMKHCRQDLRTSLIISLMIICFEGIHGNYKSAAAQLYTGLSLIQDFQVKTRRDSLHPQGFCSPSPDIVEDFLVQSFGRLEIQAMSVFDPRPVEVHTFLKQEGRETISAMPSSFVTLGEARIYLDLITRRIMHFNGSIHTSRTTPTNSDVTQSRHLARMLGSGDTRNYNPIPWIDLKVPLSQMQDTIHSDALNREKFELLSDLNAWNKASNDFLLSSLNQNPYDAIAALTMCIAAQSNKISLCSCFFVDEIAYDEFLPEFKQIVESASQVITLQSIQRLSAESPNVPTSSHTGLNFSFELGIIPALYTVMAKCRHGPLRREALKLLRDHPRREGVWDSIASAALGAWIIELEEEGSRRFMNVSPPWSPATPGFSGSDWNISAENAFSRTNFDLNAPPTYLQIPEEARVRKAKMRFDLLERRANLFCMQTDFDTGLLVEKTGLYCW